MNKIAKVPYKYFEVNCLNDADQECNFDLTSWISEATNLLYEGSLEDTIKEVNGVLGRIEDVKLLENNFYALNFMRLDALSNTYKVKESQKAEHIDLDDDEYIGKNTVMLYDPKLNVVMVQSNRESFGVFSIESYINSFYSSPTCFFRPIVNDYNINDCYKYKTKKIDVRFSDLKNFSAYKSKKFEKILSEMRSFNGVTAHIEIGLGRKNARKRFIDGLDPSTVYELSSDIKNNAHAISSAKLTIDDDNKSHIIDLLENIECDSITFKIPERGELEFSTMANKMLSKYKGGVRNRIMKFLK